MAADIALNLVLYMPVGFLAFLVFIRSRKPSWALLGATAVVQFALWESFFTSAI